MCGLLWGLCAWARAEAPSVLEMMGRPTGTKPDVLFLAPQLLDEPKAYRAIFERAGRLGTALPNGKLSAAAFYTEGPLPVLAAAGYRLLPIRDVPWQEACARLKEILDLRKRTRLEDGIVQAPICALLCEQVSAAVLANSLPELLESDALILLAPQGEGLPLVVCWRNRVWPAHQSELPVRVDHWVPTLAEIVGLPIPAEVADASIVPLLTGVGYQRPLDFLPAVPQPARAERPYTEVRLYGSLPEDCPWVPDYTALFPTERAFVRGLPPLSTEALSSLTPTRKPLGIYLRTALKRLDLNLPAGVSCVVRTKGRPVHSVWQPKEPTRWFFDSPEETPLELFLLLPPQFDPATLPLFAQPEVTPEEA